MRPNEVFLSYASGDRDHADRIAKALQIHGIPVWYSSTSIIGAQQWHDEIGAALRRCDWFLILLSPNSIISKWVKRELLFALQDDGYENKIVPIVIYPCDYEQLSWTLSSIHIVDFSVDFNEGSRDLLRVWGIGLKN